LLDELLSLEPLFSSELLLVLVSPVLLPLLLCPLELWRPLGLLPLVPLPLPLPLVPLADSSLVPLVGEERRLGDDAGVLLDRLLREDGLALAELAGEALLCGDEEAAGEAILEAAVAPGEADVAVDPFGEAAVLADEL